MSGYEAGSLYVKIVPDASGFGAEAAQQIRQQAPATEQVAQQTTRPGGDTQVKALQQAAQTAGATLAALEQQAAKVSAEFLVGAKTEAEATAALEAYAAAGVTAAEANVRLALSTGEMVSAADVQILTLRRQAAAQAQVTAAEEHHAQRFRQQIRRVAEGEAPLSSAFGPAAIARFGAGALAFGAFITTMQHAEEALKVTGDAATTTEGKFRNLAGALLTGDVVGAFEAINAQADTTRESLDKMLKDPNLRGGDLVALGDDANRTADRLDTLVAAQKAVGDDSSFAKAIREVAEEERGAANEALALARAFETAASAAADVEGAIGRAGSEVAAFGEQVRGPGAVAAEAGRPRGAPSNVDSTATNATANAIAESIASRTKGLQDDLAQARKEEAQAARTEKNLQDVAEGAAARHQATVAAQTRVDQIQQQIDDQAAQKVKEAATARKRAASEAEAARNEAQRAYEQGVANDIKRLEIAADAAGNVGKAEAKYVAALKRESQDAKLSTQTQLGYQAALTNERQNQAQALKAAAAAEQDRKLALDDLRIQQADLTTGSGDNIAAINRKIGDLKKLRSKTKQYSDEWIAFTSDITSLQLRKQNLGSKAGSTFSTQDLFAEAAREQATFGSNISGQPNGVLSGQDARGAFGAQVTQDLAGQVQGAQLTTQQQMLATLQSIDVKLSGGARGATRKQLEVDHYAAIEGLRGAAMAAAYGYGAN